MTPLRLSLIACPVFRPELEVLVPKAKTSVTIRYLDMALHEGAAKTLCTALQAAIDETSTPQSDAIALAYGLCNRGIIGLAARSVPVVIPRAHDCLGILLGGTACYLAQLDAEPGTYYQSAGWLAQAREDGQLRQQNMVLGTADAANREELIAKYGEENAQYLIEQFAQFTRHYTRLAFISTPVPKVGQWERAASEMAKGQGWKFERLEGDLAWLRRVLEGEWSEMDFLALQPGERVALRGDAQIIGVEPAT